MKLYFSPGACSLSPHIVLRETGSAFTPVKVDLGGKKLPDGADFRAINPKGQVPVLQLDDGQILTEGPVIVQYVADQAKATSLLPAAGTMERYRVQEWLNHITSELHKGFSPLFSPALDAAAKGVLATALKGKLAAVDRQLEGRTYLTGDTFTVADAYLFVVTNWARMVKLDIEDLPNLQRFRATVAARPAVKAAMQAEGLIPA